MTGDKDSYIKLLADCRIDTFRSGGPGGQHQNTTDSAVRLTHMPTGIVIVCRESRSQIKNRQIALERLQQKIKERNRKKKKRVSTKPTRSSIKRRLDKKKQNSQKKSDRRRPDF